MKAVLLAAVALQLRPCHGLDNGVAALPRMGWSYADTRPPRCPAVPPAAA